MAKYYFEDFKVGDRWDFGAWSITREELIGFAREWDPQPIHVDEQAASNGPYGGLIASGWQTVMKCVRLWVAGLMADTTGAGSPGLEDIRWLKPVRAGDRITASVEVFEVADSKSRPDRGRVHFLFSGVDASGAPVMTCRGTFFILRRTTAAS